MASFQSYLKEIKSSIVEVPVEAVKAAVAAHKLGNSSTAIVDIREKDEWVEGAIPGSSWVPRGFLEQRIEELVPDPGREVILYCSGGTRSALAARSLKELGYADVKSMIGGFTAWKRAGLEFERPITLTPAQSVRYSRHIMLPEVGEAGQIRLLKSKILCVGAGGLGAPSSLYLAAAGVGTIGMVDDDVVDESNLQRQVIHNTKRIGQPKVESARETLTALNPDVHFVAHKMRMSAENVLELLAPYDLIVDGADNFPTRYLLNDAALRLGIPVLHASIFRFEGQVTAFSAQGGPCYRCLYPAPPPPDMAPSCQEGGVLGVLPGVIGTLQANEALKILLGIGQPMYGRLLVFDALKLKFRELKLRRDPACPTCGEKAKRPIELIDYEAFCAV